MAPVAKPRYGKSVIGKRVRCQDAATKLWRTGVVNSYHGGYLRHTIKPDDGEEDFHAHLHVDGCEFLIEDAPPVPDVVGRYVSVQSAEDRTWHAGQVLAFDGLTHTVKQADGSCHYVNLRKQAYMLLEQAPPAAPAAGAAAAGSGAAPAAAGKKAGITLKGAGSSAGGSKQPPASGGAGVAKQRAASSTKDDKEKSGGGGGGGGPPRHPSPKASGGSGGSGGGAAGGGGGRRATPLNMSHAGVRDREAARALLAFSAPRSDGDDDAPTPASGKVSSLSLIAAAANAAATAAGLPDPATTAIQATIDGGDAAADGQQQRSGSQQPAAAAPAAAAGDEGTSGRGSSPAALQAVLGGLQQQMQRLVAQEERRSLDIVRLKAQLRNCEDDRDEALRGKEKAAAALEVSEDKVCDLQDDVRALRSQVETLQKENARLAARLAAGDASESGVLGSSRGLDASALQGQLTGIRSEMATCKAESSQLLTQLRTIAALATGQSVGPPPVLHPSAAYHSDGLPPAAAMQPPPPAAAGGIRIKKASARRRAAGGNTRGVSPAAALAAAAAPSVAPPGPGMMMDRAAAAALAAPPNVLHMQQARVGSRRQPMAPVDARPAAASAAAASGVASQLRQMAPGSKLVFGPGGSVKPFASAQQQPQPQQRRQRQQQAAAAEQQLLPKPELQPELEQLVGVDAAMPDAAEEGEPAVHPGPAGSGDDQLVQQQQDQEQQDEQGQPLSKSVSVELQQLAPQQPVDSSASGSSGSGLLAGSKRKRNSSDSDSTTPASTPREGGGAVDPAAPGESDQQTAVAAAGVGCASPLRYVSAADAPMAVAEAAAAANDSAGDTAAVAAAMVAGLGADSSEEQGSEEEGDGQRPAQRLKTDHLEAARAVTGCA